ncbi:AcrR family transcriptional regulator [Allocatelliglobosispora scoriae]|uniref:AcrR family transcriptional regulator n=1 Tax=Allocatelliglobosispora scoriae TaxID=643052 RepID=A0A841BKX5_9ACTN|nr:TetR/AcrR family transcriptional regulator [Allocatelliglobosispora scoriae]MBB5867392.1 AcrR family transcriptional regulator [Allocatelliglobosispora scoriae]
MAATNSSRPATKGNTTEPPRRTGARARPGTLTQDAILDGVIALIEREGVNAMSMRRLGDELGVDATAFYRHFRDKDDLILAAFDRVTGELALEIRALDAAAGWRERLQNLAMGSWRLAERYPAIFSLCFARITGGPAEREIVEFMLSTLAATGLPADRVVLHYRAFGDTTLSLCGAAATVAALDPALREKDANAWSRIYGVLPRAEYPAARAHAAELNAVADQEIYERTVEALLDGIQAAVTGL